MAILQNAGKSFAGRLSRNLASFGLGNGLQAVFAGRQGSPPKVQGGAVRTRRAEFDVNNESEQLQHRISCILAWHEVSDTACFGQF